MGAGRPADEVSPSLLKTTHFVKPLVAKLSHKFNYKKKQCCVQYHHPICVCVWHAYIHAPSPVAHASRGATNIWGLYFSWNCVCPILNSIMKCKVLFLNTCKGTVSDAISMNLNTNCKYEKVAWTKKLIRRCDVVWSFWVQISTVSDNKAKCTCVCAPPIHQEGHSLERPNGIPKIYKWSDN